MKWLLLLLGFLVALILIAWLVDRHQRTVHASRPRTFRHHLHLTQVARYGKSGDLLLFTTNIPFVYSHSAILYVDPASKQPYVWESNRFNHKEFQDGLTGQYGKEGPQLIPLFSKLTHYQGTCRLFSLQPSLSAAFGGSDARADEFLRIIFRVCSPLTFSLSQTWINLQLSLSTGKLFQRLPRAWVHALRRKLCGEHSINCAELTSFTYFALNRLLLLTQEQNQLPDDELIRQWLYSDEWTVMLPHQLLDRTLLGAFAPAWSKVLTKFVVENESETK